uniref:SID1 transmembrane family member 1-like n=2 Tax=Hirondellea gigas TaxID=1518452 RepID=A0A6A7G3U4_9CRUS
MERRDLIFYLFVISILSLLVTAAAALPDQNGETAATKLLYSLDKSNNSNITVTNTSLVNAIQNYLDSFNVRSSVASQPNKPIPHIFQLASEEEKQQLVNERIGSADSIAVTTHNGSDSSNTGASFGPPKTVNYIIIQSDINEVYVYNVSKKNEYLFEYAYNSSILEHYALRVTVSSEAACFSMPVLVVVRQQRGALSWQIPLAPPPNTQQFKDYTTVSRILCPVRNFLYPEDVQSSRSLSESRQGSFVSGPVQRLSIDVSTQSEVGLSFTIKTEYFLNFDLKLDEAADVVSAPYAPVFLQFTFPEGVDTVLVHVKSNTTICGAVTLQHKTCPVWDLEETIRYADFYQTMSMNAAITITRDQYPDGFYVVIMTLNNDRECSGDYQTIDTDRNKLLSVLVTEKITHQEFLFGILTGLLFCLISYAVVVAKWCYDKRQEARNLTRLGPTPSSSPTLPRRRRRRSGRRSRGGATTEPPHNTTTASHNTVGFASHSSYAAQAGGGGRQSSFERYNRSTVGQHGNTSSQICTSQHVSQNSSAGPGGYPSSVFTGTVQSAAAHAGVASGSGVDSRLAAGGSAATRAVTGGGPAAPGSGRVREGQATVILSEDGRFDDLAELTRELNESMSALQRDNPTLATETEEFEVIHDSDSSMNADVDTYSEDDYDDDYYADLEADSAEGGFDTSCGDSRSRGGGSNWSRSADNLSRTDDNLSRNGDDVTRGFGNGNNWSQAATVVAATAAATAATAAAGDNVNTVVNNNTDRYPVTTQNNSEAANAEHGHLSGGDAIVGRGRSSDQATGTVTGEPQQIYHHQPQQPQYHQQIQHHQYQNPVLSIDTDEEELNFGTRASDLRGGMASQASKSRQVPVQRSSDRTLYLHDMTRKRTRVLMRRTTRYITTLLSCFIFYFVPVLQLVSTYQKVLDETGNQDVCYYNFLCANPYGLLSDSNHIVSNVGYVGLGILFGVVTCSRQRKYNAEVQREPHVAQLGIPRDSSLYYTLSLSLVMVGMLSASYHVCPNRSNFQFDTAFMYVIAVLLMLQLYQNRHTDVSASADTVFIALSVTVLLGVIGGLFGSTWFWIISSILHACICLVVSAYVYYIGRWSLINTMRSMYRNGGARYLSSWICTQVQQWRHWRSLKSHFGTRVALLLIANLCNWALMLFGLTIRPRDYDTYLLGVLLLNLVIYVVFYLFMKKGYNEHLGSRVKLTLLLLVVIWVSAICVFFKRTTDWSVSPAQSRDLNLPCILFNFYDWHDIWHFLSSLALFTSFYLIMIVDDDLAYTPRDMIAVF